MNAGNDNNRKSIILMGFMGAGKTSVGETVSRILNMPMLDTDRMIERQEGRTVSEIFSYEGETAFRNMETHLLEELSGSGTAAVISIGGGMPVRSVNRGLLRRMGIVFYLQARIDTLAGRLQGDTSRPLLQSSDLQGRIERLLLAREEIYLQTADCVIATDELDIEQTARTVIERYRQKTLI